MGCLYIKLYITASASLGDGGGGDSYNEYNVRFYSLVRHSYPGGQREKKSEILWLGQENACEITWVGQGMSSEIHTLARRAWHIMVPCAICIHM